MALTEDLVALTRRHVEDEGPPAGLIRNDETFWRTVVAELISQRPGGQVDVWLFAYGSLLWSPVNEHVEERTARLRGWHRAFRIRLPLHRGTPEQPGLMMGLDRGGQCRGIAFRLDRLAVEHELDKLVRREMPVRRAVGHLINRPRWVTVETDGGPVGAIAYTLDRRSPSYVGGLSIEETADMLAVACGPGGSCAEYLRETVERLETLGIHDRNLWHLQALVAERIARAWPIMGRKN